MSDWIDFKELRKSLDFRKVLSHYGVELKKKGEQHHGFCPLPKHSGKRNSPSFSANQKRGIFQCFGCGEGGNVLDFAVLMEGGNPKNGADVARVAVKLRELVGDSDRSEPTKEREESEEENALINAPLDFELKGLDPKHPYLFNRGFTAETIAKFGLGFSSRGLLANRIAIPIRNSEGLLVGYAGRVVNDEKVSEDNPKYRFPGRRKRKGITYDFRKSLLLYNAERFKAAVADLVIVEGFPSVWWLNQAGISDVASPMGASCSEEQGRIIVSLTLPNGRVWIFTDGDAAGERCAHDIFAHVARDRFVRRIPIKEDTQPTDWSLSELRRWWETKPR
jgi:DNA primase